jgi:hypothetical protein
MLNGKSLRIKRAKGRNMKILRTTAAAVISSFLMGGACIPAWSAPTSQGLTVAQATMPETTVGSAITVLGSPEFSRLDSRPAERNCKPGHMYSAHEMVGDPQACIMGSFSGFGGARSTIAAVPAL